MNQRVDAADACVAAFLSVTEGVVADVLVAGGDRRPAHDFDGRLSFSRPKWLDRYVLDRCEADYDPQFLLGYDLTYAAPKSLPVFDESRPKVAVIDRNALFVRGGVVADARLDTANQVQQTRDDRTSQEDSLRFVCAGKGSALIGEARPIDVNCKSNGQFGLLVDYRMTAVPKGEVTFDMTGGKVVTVALRCFANGGVNMAQVTTPTMIPTTGAPGLGVSAIRITSASPVR